MDKFFWQVMNVPEGYAIIAHETEDERHGLSSNGWVHIAGTSACLGSCTVSAMKTVICLFETFAENSNKCVHPEAHLPAPLLAQVAHFPVLMSNRIVAHSLGNFGKI